MEVFSLLNEIKRAIYSRKRLRAAEEQAAATQEINASIEEMASMSEHLKYISSLL